MKPLNKQIKALFFILLLMGGQSATAQITLGAKGVYGIYQNSLVTQYLSEKLDLIYYNPKNNWGLGLTFKRNDLSFEDNVIDPADYNQYQVSFNKTFLTQKRGSFTAQLDANYLLSSDDNVNGKIPIYAAGKWVSSSYKHGLNVAAHYFSTDTATALSLRAGYGRALFNYYVWAQADFVYSQYSNTVQEIDQGWLFHPEITIYAIPKKLTFTAYAMIGEQVFSYNPNAGVLYMSDVLLKSSYGLTSYWQATKKLKPYLDVQYEGYENRQFGDDFTAFYLTFGLFWTF